MVLASGGNRLQPQAYRTTWPCKLAAKISCPNWPHKVHAQACRKLHLPAALTWNTLGRASTLRQPIMTRIRGSTWLASTCVHVHTWCIAPHAMRIRGHTQLASTCVHTQRKCSIGCPDRAYHLTPLPPLLSILFSVI